MPPAHPSLLGRAPPPPSARNPGRRPLLEMEPTRAQTRPILHGDVMGVTASAKLGTPALPPPWFPGAGEEVPAGVGSAYSSWAGGQLPQWLDGVMG